MRNAHTVEEYTAYGNTVIIMDYGNNYRTHPVRTTEELLATLEEMKGKSIDVSFLDERQVHRPPLRKGVPPLTSTYWTDIMSFPQNGYFVKRSSRRFWCAKGFPVYRRTQKSSEVSRPPRNIWSRTNHSSEAIPLK